MTPLHHAAWIGDAACAVMLLCAGADPDPMDDRKMTPLHLAVRGDHAAVMNILLEWGSDACRLTPPGLNALAVARTSGALDCMERLTAWFQHRDLEACTPPSSASRVVERL